MRLGGSRPPPATCSARLLLALTGRLPGGEGCGGARGRVPFRALGAECSILGRACWSVTFTRKPPCQPPTLLGLLSEGTLSTGDSWMESTGFPSSIWRQKRRKLGGGTQAPRVESIVITACRGFCCLVFAILQENLLARGGEGSGSSRPVCVFRARKAGDGRDGVSQPTAPLDLPWPPAQTLGPARERGACTPAVRQLRDKASDNPADLPRAGREGTGLPRAERATAEHGGCSVKTLDLFSSCQGAEARAGWSWETRCVHAPPGVCSFRGRNCRHGRLRRSAQGPERSLCAQPGRRGLRWAGGQVRAPLPQCMGRTAEALRGDQSGQLPQSAGSLPRGTGWASLGAGSGPATLA